MIRRRRPIRRTAIVRKAKKVRAANPFKPKHTSKRKQKNARYKVERPKTRQRCYDRDGGCCRCPCKRPLILKTDKWWDLANMNEVPSRAHGGDPTNTRDVLTMTPECHARFTAGDLKIDKVDPDLGCDGRVLMTGKLADGRYVENYASDPKYDFVP